MRKNDFLFKLCRRNKKKTQTLQIKSLFHSTNITLFHRGIRNSKNCEENLSIVKEIKLISIFIDIYENQEMDNKNLVKQVAENLCRLIKNSDIPIWTGCNKVADEITYVICLSDEPINEYKKRLNLMIKGEIRFETGTWINYIREWFTTDVKNNINFLRLSITDLATLLPSFDHEMIFIKDKNIIYCIQAYKSMFTNKCEIETELIEIQDFLSWLSDLEKFCSYNIWNEDVNNLYSKLCFHPEKLKMENLKNKRINPKLYSKCYNTYFTEEEWKILIVDIESHLSHKKNNLMEIQRKI